MIYFSFTLLTITLIVVLYLYVKAQGELAAKKRQERHHEEKLKSREVEILDSAHRKAASIVADISFVKEATEQVIEADLAKLADNEAASAHEEARKLRHAYKTQLVHIAKNYEHLLQNVASQMQEAAERELGQFRSLLTTETSRLQQIVEKKVEEEYAKVEADVAAYKEAQLRKVREDIYKMINTVSKRVISKTLSLEEHEELVMKALEEAKFNF